MDEIILNLLKQNGRVIIPDFGALIVKQKSPFTVIFNEFLQYNDGALIGAIQKELDIERDDAANKARDMAKELQEKLDRGDEITLNEIGILSKSSTGKISLRDLSLGETPPKQPDTPIIEEEKTSAVEFDLEENKTVEDIPSEKKVVEPEPEKVEEKVVEENNAKEDPVATKTPPTINDIHKNKAVKIEKETSVEATPPPNYRVLWRR